MREGTIQGEVVRSHMDGPVRVIDEVRLQSVTLRPDLAAVVPIEVAAGPADLWSFEPPPDDLQWVGEGERCDVTRDGGAIRCELVSGHLDWWLHSSQRSAV